ncbi:MAG: hypothetical protein Q7S00_00655 [bacterium]|nr:hypothetical protein [bacterium]
MAKRQAPLRTLRQQRVEQAQTMERAQRMEPNRPSVGPTPSVELVA